MSINSQKTPRANMNVMLQEAQIPVRESVEIQGGRLHELEPSHYCGRRALVFESKEKGITVAIRADIPEKSPLRDTQVTSNEALLLLGALTFSLQTQNVETKLINGQRGLEAFVLSSRLCEAESDPGTISRYLNRLQDIVQAIEPVLSLTGQTLIDRVIDAVRLHIAAPTKEVQRVEPVIVPTFDEEARNRMMQQMNQ
jgi:hypothetical protein